MSLRINQYILFGVKLSYKDYINSDLSKLENKYDDNPFSANFNSKLIMLVDGMNGEYIYVGECYKKSSNCEYLNSCEVPELTNVTKNEVKNKIKHCLGLDVQEIKTHFITHSR